MKKSVAGLVLLVPVVTLVGCYSSATPNPTRPDVCMLKFERNPDASQGPQSQVKSGGKVTVPYSWLGPNRANIRVYTEEYVRQFTVTGTGKGKCYHKTSSGLLYPSPYALTVSFPTHVETAP